ncbi:hypothetical protein [Fibrella forsythiae]|uniref:Uncharacterized protein n=1 Tax=Fibrella forsythiae TaxID=2817061 RepID=A0ABS3JJE2_9BACT|nr:hypothetical protein [Fibrella forsythiae]MBO0950125.1 hypothetical protein [Fibrella forsythiae]
MKMHNESLAFALRQVWVNQPDHQADTPATAYLLDTEPAVNLPDTVRQRTLDRLQIRLTTPSLGQLLQQQTQAKDVIWQQEQTGFSAETLNDLCNDAIHPTSVPVMRMKRLIHFLRLSTEQAFAALQKTADQYNWQAGPSTFSYAQMGRLSHPDRPASTTTSTGRHFLFESDEALQLYLNRLGDVLASESTT